MYLKFLAQYKYWAADQTKGRLAAYGVLGLQMRGQLYCTEQCCSSYSCSFVPTWVASHQVIARGV
jgi:hypothetical protein